VALPTTARWLLTLGAQFKAQLTLESAFEFENRMFGGRGARVRDAHRDPRSLAFGIVTPGFLMRHFRMAVMVIAIARRYARDACDDRFALPMSLLCVLRGSPATAAPTSAS